MRYLALVIGSVALLSSCGGESHVAMPLPPETTVQVQSVARSILPSPESFVGNIRSQQTVVIATKMMGRIQRLDVQEGQKVKKGDLLVQVDAAEVHGAVEQSKAGLGSAEVQFTNAKRDYDRLVSLYEKGAITRQQLDQMEGGLAAAGAQKAQANANLRVSQSLLSYGRLTAPEDGVITRKFMDVGNLAAPGVPILTIENPQALEVSIQVPEDKSQKLAVAQAVRVELGAKIIRSEISAVVPSSDPMTRTNIVKVTIPSDQGFAPGQFVRVRLDALSHLDLVVPATAVASQGQMDSVFVAEAGIARLRWVQTGQRDDGKVQILSGLHEGDSLIVPVPSDLHDGYPVKVKPVAP